MSSSNLIKYVKKSTKMVRIPKNAYRSQNSSPRMNPTYFGNVGDELEVDDTDLESESGFLTSVMVKCM